MNSISVFGAGAIIRSLRENANVSIAELGRRIGVSRSMMSRYESNERALTIDAMHSVADALGLVEEEVVVACLQTAYPELMNTRPGKSLRKIVDAIVAIS